MEWKKNGDQQRDHNQSSQSNRNEKKKLLLKTERIDRPNEPIRAQHTTVQRSTKIIYTLCGKRASTLTTLCIGGFGVWCFGFFAASLLFLLYFLLFFFRFFFFFFVHIPRAFFVFLWHYNVRTVRACIVCMCQCVWMCAYVMVGRKPIGYNNKWKSRGHIWTRATTTSTATEDYIHIGYMNVYHTTQHNTTHMHMFVWHSEIHQLKAAVKVGVPTMHKHT